MRWRRDRYSAKCVFEAEQFLKMNLINLGGSRKEGHNNTKTFLLSAYLVLTTELSTLKIFSLLIFTTTLRHRYYYSQLTEEETKSERNYIICPRFHNSRPQIGTQVSLITKPMFIITRLCTEFGRQMGFEKNQDPSKIEKDGTQTFWNEGKPFFLTEWTEENNHMKRFIPQLADDRGDFQTWKQSFAEYQDRIS